MMPYTAATAPPATAATASPPHTHQPTGLLGGLTRTAPIKPRPPRPPPLAGGLRAASCRLLALLRLLLLLRNRGVEAASDSPRGDEGCGAAGPVLIWLLCCRPMPALLLLVPAHWKRGRCGPVLGAVSAGPDLLLLLLRPLSIRSSFLLVLLRLPAVLLSALHILKLLLLVVLMRPAGGGSCWLGGCGGPTARAVSCAAGAAAGADEAEVLLSARGAGAMGLPATAAAAGWSQLPSGGAAVACVAAATGATLEAAW